MKDYEIRYLHKKLLEEKERVSDALNMNTEYGYHASIKESTDELSMYDNHPADIATETYEFEKQYAIKDSYVEHIADINEALEKIEHGEYGICDFCGNEIGYERLEALPTAKLCIHCQKESMTPIEDLEYDRPVEEDVLYPPFGRTFMDEKDYTGYDGEDAWQDVQKYGSSSGPQDISVNRLIDYTNLFQYSDEDPGIVERIDEIDNEEYEEQLPDKK